MAHVPWYQQAAEINNQHEREQFIQGVFGFRPKEKRPVIASLIAGSAVAYLAGAVAVGAKHKAKTKAKKKK
jgi:hypothetical protein